MLETSDKMSQSPYFFALWAFQIKSKIGDSSSAAAQWIITLHVLQYKSPVSGHHGSKPTVPLTCPGATTSCFDAALLCRGYQQSVPLHSLISKHELSWIVTQFSWMTTNRCWLHVTEIETKWSRYKHHTDIRDFQSLGAQLENSTVQYYSVW